MLHTEKCREAEGTVSILQSLYSHGENETRNPRTIKHTVGQAIIHKERKLFIEPFLNKYCLTKYSSLIYHGYKTAAKSTDPGTHGAYKQVSTG